MPLPNTTVPLAPSIHTPPPGFLVRFPEDTWSKLAAASREGHDVSFTVDGGILLSIPGQDPIPLETQHSAATELYTYFDGSLNALGVANTRLGVPFSAVSTSRAAEKVRQTNAALDRQRQARADRVVGKPTKPVSSDAAAAAKRSLSYQQTPPPPVTAPALLAAASLPMGRTMSGPSAISLATTEKIPLKTRIVQLLALGPASVEEIIERTGGNPDDVMRVVKVIGQPNNGRYRLRPPQYAKIKIGQWKYTYDEKVTVIELARKAFDELGLEPDAEEREELEKKAKEALEGGPGAAGSSSGASQPATPPEPVPVPAPPPQVSPKKERVPVPERSRHDPIAGHESPAPSPALASPSSKPKSTGPKVERTKVGKQIAKMRQNFAQRSSSLPATKGPDGTASPRRGPSASPDPVPLKLEPSPARKGTPLRKEALPKKEKKKARDYSYTSSESESDDGRGRSHKKASTATNGKTAAAAANPANGSARQRPSPSYSSSEDELAKRRKPAVKAEPRSRERQRDTERGRDKALPAKREKERPAAASSPPPSTKRKSPPNTNGAAAHRSGPLAAAPNAKALRERYAEIYPVYQSLSASLARAFQRAERVRDGQNADLADTEDLAKQIAKYQEYHDELQGIRAWFAPQ